MDLKIALGMRFETGGAYADDAHVGAVAGQHTGIGNTLGLSIAAVTTASAVCTIIRLAWWAMLPDAPLVPRELAGPC